MFVGNFKNYLALILVLAPVLILLLVALFYLPFSIWLLFILALPAAAFGVFRIARSPLAAAAAPESFSEQTEIAANEETVQSAFEPEITFEATAEPAAVETFVEAVPVAEILFDDFTISEQIISDQLICDEIIFDDLAVGVAPAAAAPPKNESGETEKILADLVVLSQSCAVVLDIQKAQLNSVVGDTEQAALHIISGVTEIRRAVEELISELTARMTESAQAVEKSSDSVSQFKGLQSYIEQRSTELESDLTHDQEQLEEITKTTGFLTQFVKSAEQISVQTKILALNAGIEAARMGDEGRGFAIIATEMNRLSNVFRETAEKNIGQRIKMLTGTLEAQLKQKLETNTAEQATLRDFETQYNRLSEQYVKMTVEHDDFIKQTTERNQYFSDLVMDLLARIQFQDITRQKIEQVLKALTTVGDEVKKLALQATDEHSLPLSADADSGHSAIDTLFADYVMEEQRANHLQALGQQTGEPLAESTGLPAIELF